MCSGLFSKKKNKQTNVPDLNIHQINIEGKSDKNNIIFRDSFKVSILKI